MLNDETEAESYELRQLVECASLLLPRFTFDAEEAAMMGCAHEKIVAGSFYGNVWFRANAESHESLVGFSRNQFAVQLIHQQNSLSRVGEAATFQTLPFARVRQSRQEHMDILDAAESGDLQWAAALLKRHLQAVATFRHDNTE
ncbi:FCD domain-containing protein [Sedimentitalea sp. XS_ASV28]|uniref:FCD domain-containing protein n=1 Tax=Sedimentitalea sp. XS_ASV28 TaxID=3241296 RepID=UPI003517D175